ncbi:transposase [Actinoplanes philippinensis]|nr:transposase [Actinoplanes philippinensis]
MTAPAHEAGHVSHRLTPSRSLDPGLAREDEVRRLEESLSAEFWADAGWHADLRILLPQPQHPAFGWPCCLVNDCETSSIDGKLCRACRNRWDRSVSLDEFAAQPIPAGRSRWKLFDTPCAVPGCPRPQHLSTDALCNTHRSLVFTRFGSITPENVAALLAQPDVGPLSSLGDCKVLTCVRLAHNLRGLCLSHHGRWKQVHRQPGFDLDRWCLTEPGLRRAGLINLRAIPRLVRAQMIAATQRLAESGAKVNTGDWHLVIGNLRHQQAVSLHTAQDGDMLPRLRNLLELLRREARRAISTWDQEQHRDVWDLGVLGLRGAVDFTAISQPWLRAGMKWWTAEDVHRRRSTKPAGVLRDHVNSMALLSESLRLHRRDAGVQPGELGRSDILAFLTRLSHLDKSDMLTPAQHVKVVRHVKAVLTTCRDAGLTKPGNAMAGLSGEFSIRRGDLPPAPGKQSWRALPPAVFHALIAGLPELEKQIVREFRVAVELIMDTGRRPDEICRLPQQCLDQDADGNHVLVYTDFKANRVERRLPIAASTAQLIREQQQRTRDRFPNTPDRQLVLLPARQRNSHGARAIRATTLTQAHRQWVDSLPAPTLPDGTAFPREYLVPYAYRHSFAQRHADAGTPMDVLRELMGHRSTETTQIYYRITEKRTRKAVDQLAAHQYDGTGQHLAREITQLIDSEHTRRGVGQVAVPFGVCAEPSNVKAGGTACPYRLRCLGCGHFRTDASYLPELRLYLDRLLADRERVLATTDLEDWARAEATPSDTEITKVRHLIRRVESDLANLTAEEQAHIKLACATVRQVRQHVSLGMPSVLAPTADPPAPGRRP